MPAKRRTRPPQPSEAILRDFQDRGFQWLLDSPACLPALFGVLESLHPTLISLFDVDRAGRVQRTLLPPDLRRRENDALYTIPFRSGVAGTTPEIPALVVVEHKSRPDPMVALQTLQYQVAFWAKQAPPFHPGRTEAPRLSPPLTLLVYTGEEPWVSTYRLSDVFGAPSELLEAAPLGVGPVLMLDLPRVSEEAIRRLDSPLAQALRLIQLERAAPDLYAAGLAECLNRLAAAPPESHPDVWRVV